MARFSLKSFFGRSDGTLAPLRFNSWAAGGRGAALFEKSAEALELERMNPLRGVDEWRLGQIFDDARDGIFADLAWLYNEIEGVEPALMSCCETRESAAGEMGWVVRTADAERTHGFDEALAGEQRAALLEAYGVVADDLPELAGHMVTAFFRGAAHAQPLWNADGTLAGFRPLDLWNFALDRGSGLWYWNADASRDESAFQAVPPGELVTLAAARHVDHAALPIFIRAALGAKRYGVWLDRFGIPPVGVIMPPSAERGEQGAYMELARKFARGGSGVLPNGSQVTYGTEARAVCPFPDFIRFQQQQIYAVGIGRVQSGETDGSNLGGNAAGVVDAALSRIVRRDARRIARALNDCVTRRILGRLFPGRPVLAQFAWDTEAKRTGREALEEAGLARNAGLEIDRAQLEEMTGYTLRPAPQAPAPGGFGLPNSGAGAGMPDSGLAKPLQNARKPGEAQDTPPEPAPALKRVLAAFRSDLGPAAEELQKVIDLPEGEMREACKDLVGRLPDLLPSDPAMAAILAEELAGAFAEAAGETTVLNARGGNPDNRGQFSKTEGPQGRPREPETPKTSDAFGTTDTDKLTADDYKLGRERLRSVVSHILAKKEGEEEKAFWRADLGWVGIDYGTPGNPNSKPDRYAGGHGISHIQAKHGDAAKNLEEMFTRGEAFKHNKSERKVYLIKGRDVLVLSKKRNGRLLVTDFGPASDHDLAVYKSKGKYHVRGENE